MNESDNENQYEWVDERKVNLMDVDKVNLTYR